MTDKFLNGRENMADVSLSAAGVKATGGGVLVLAWIESNMNLIIGLLTIVYFLCQIVVILPKTVSEIRRHFANFLALFRKEADQ